MVEKTFACNNNESLIYSLEINSNCTIDSHFAIIYYKTGQVSEIYLTHAEIQLLLMDMGYNTIPEHYITNFDYLYTEKKLSIRSKIKYFVNRYICGF